MTETGTRGAVASYLADLRAALSDLPPAEVAEILDDVGPHLTEVADELGEDDLPQRLRERLGEPEQYAAELRSAAGYPPRPVVQQQVPSTRTTGVRVALWLLAAAVLLLFLAGPFGVMALLLLAVLVGVAVVAFRRDPAAFGNLPELRWLRDPESGGVVAEYARLMQPGWWVLRALVAALLLVAATGLPRGYALVFGSPVGLGFLLVVAIMVVGSVWLGRRTRSNRRWLWLVLPLNVFAVVAGLYLLDRVAVGGDTYVDFGGSPTTVQVPMFGNIYPFDSTGQPLTGVYLYDENGQPITSEYGTGECMPASRIPVPANQYPQPVYEYDDRTGRCVASSGLPTTSRLPTATPTR